MADSSHTNSAFAAAAALAIHVLLQHRTTRPRALSNNRATIHPGGPVDARSLAESILNGSETQFQDLFRMNKASFQALVSWLQAHAGLHGNRYQISEQKVMIVLWILAHAESQRNTAHRFQVSQSSVSETVKTLLPLDSEGGERCLANYYYGMVELQGLAAILLG